MPGWAETSRAHATFRPLRLDSQLMIEIFSQTVRSDSHLERETGLEPATLALARRCSTTELLPHAAELSIPRSQKAGQTAAGALFMPLFGGLDPLPASILTISPSRMYKIRE